MSRLTTGRTLSASQFTFEGQPYRYVVERYNTTWLNERAVEIPIVVAAIKQRPGARILEVGNVLSHYGVTGHAVVDKYERADGVINCDVLDFDDPDPFDLIVSVSTLEHTGFEEEQLEPEKPAHVMDHLSALLRDGGMALVTFPRGYNPHLDRLVDDRPEAFGQLAGLRRTSSDNQWRQQDVDELRDGRYGHPFPAANVLLVARRGPDSPPRITPDRRCDGPRGRT